MIDTFFIVKIIYIIANIRLKILRIFVILMIEIMEILIFVKVDTLAFKEVLVWVQLIQIGCICVLI